MTTCAWILLASSLPCWPGLEVVERLQHYRIDGSTTTELAREMARKGPEHDSGRRAWGLTRWSLRTNYDVDMEIPGRCRLREPTIYLELTIELPNWQPSRMEQGGHLAQSWERAYQGMVEHELEHRRHAHQAAWQVSSGLNAMSAVEMDCHLLEARVQRHVRKTLDAARRQSIAYDRATDFGVLNGIHP